MIIFSHQDRTPMYQDRLESMTVSFYYFSIAYCTRDLYRIKAHFLVGQ